MPAATSPEPALSLDERQRAMLGEMGVRVWQPAAAERAPLPSRAPGSAAESLMPAIVAAPQSAPVASPIAAEPSPTGSTASMDWPGLRAAVAACRACVLCESRKQTVFGVGHPQAHWMVVGEAPGEQEDLRGEPFVGAAGQLLDNMLRAIGVTRAEAAAEGLPPLQPWQQVYIANTLKCRPPRNRNPERDEMLKCEPFLQRQIELVQPRVILAMGRFAVQTLLRTDEAIGRLRGRVHRYQGVPTIVTYHPAYLLRNLPDKARAWEDLCLAAQTMESLPKRVG
jgi:DNA polymerase